MRPHWGMRLNTTFGKNLRRLRKEAGLSQEDLAAEIGIDMRYLGGIERGQENPTLEIVERAASALKVAPNTLLTESKGRLSAGT